MKRVVFQEKNPGDACGLHIFPENRADIQIARAKAFNSNQSLRSKVANNTDIQIKPGLTESSRHYTW